MFAAADDATAAAWRAWSTDFRVRLAHEAVSPAAWYERIRRNNPAYVLRTWMAAQAAQRALDHGDFAEVGRIHRLLRRPFDDQPDMDAVRMPASRSPAKQRWRRLIVLCAPHQIGSYGGPTPAWARNLSLSCSS